MDKPEILYLDSSILVVEKPYGLLTIPDGYEKNKPDLLTLLKLEFPGLWVVHRLDRTTSGIVIFARSQEAHRKLNTGFQERRIHKTYRLIAHNIPDWHDFKAEFLLKTDADRRHRTIVSMEGKPSKTNFQLCKTNPDVNLCLVEATPVSGYRHQIRSHLTHIGFPILGDLLYQKGLSIRQKELNQKAPRLMLHACRIEFDHPNTGEALTFVSQEPFSLQNFNNL